MKALKKPQEDALEYLKMLQLAENKRDAKRFQELGNDPLVQFVVQDSLANVLCPACKLWNTGYGATVMREAVSLMGGYGITEDCPGFLGQKWMDSQLEATYEGPEAVQRRQLSVTMTSPLFLQQLQNWIKDLEKINGANPDLGAGALAAGMEVWYWAFKHLETAKDWNGKTVYHGQRQGVTFPLADALCWLLASYCQIIDVLELKAKGPENPVVAEGLAGLVTFFSDLARVQSARASEEAARICAELVYGYNPNLTNEEISTFSKLREKVDISIKGYRLAKERAALAVSQVMIPEALDYPA